MWGGVKTEARGLRPPRPLYFNYCHNKTELLSSLYVILVEPLVDCKAEIPRQQLPCSILVTS